MSSSRENKPTISPFVKKVQEEFNKKKDSKWLNNQGKITISKSVSSVREIFEAMKSANTNTSMNANRIKNINMSATASTSKPEDILAMEDFWLKRLDSPIIKKLTKWDPNFSISSNESEKQLTAIKGKFLEIGSRYELDIQTFHEKAISYINGARAQNTDQLIQEFEPFLKSHGFSASTVSQQPESPNPEQETLEEETLPSDEKNDDNGDNTEQNSSGEPDMPKSSNNFDNNDEKTSTPANSEQSSNNQTTSTSGNTTASSMTSTASTSVQSSSSSSSFSTTPTASAATTSTSSALQTESAEQLEARVKQAIEKGISHLTSLIPSKNNDLASKLFNELTTLFQEQEGKGSSNISPRKFYSNVIDYFQSLSNSSPINKPLPTPSTEQQVITAIKEDFLKSTYAPKPVELKETKSSSPTGTLSAEDQVKTVKESIKKAINSHNFIIDKKDNDLADDKLVTDALVADVFKNFSALWSSSYRSVVSLTEFYAHTCDYFNTATSSSLVINAIDLPASFQENFIPYLESKKIKPNSSTTTTQETAQTPSVASNASNQQDQKHNTPPTPNQSTSTVKSSGKPRTAADHTLSFKDYKHLDAIYKFFLEDTSTGTLKSFERGYKTEPKNSTNNKDFLEQLKQLKNLKTICEHHKKYLLEILKEGEQPPAGQIDKIKTQLTAISTQITQLQNSVNLPKKLNIKRRGRFYTEKEEDVDTGEYLFEHVLDDKMKEEWIKTEKSLGDSKKSDLIPSAVEGEIENWLKNAKNVFEDLQRELKEVEEELRLKEKKDATKSLFRILPGGISFDDENNLKSELKTSLSSYNPITSHSLLTVDTDDTSIPKKYVKYATSRDTAYNLYGSESKQRKDKLLFHTENSTSRFKAVAHELPTELSDLGLFMSYLEKLRDQGYTFYERVHSKAAGVEEYEETRTPLELDVSTTINPETGEEIVDKRPTVKKLMQKLSEKYPHGLGVLDKALVKEILDVHLGINSNWWNGKFADEFMEYKARSLSAKFDFNHADSKHHVENVRLLYKSAEDMMRAAILSGKSPVYVGKDTTCPELIDAMYCLAKYFKEELKGISCEFRFKSSRYEESGGKALDKKVQETYESFVQYQDVVAKSKDRIGYSKKVGRGEKDKKIEKNEKDEKGKEGKKDLYDEGIETLCDAIETVSAEKIFKTTNEKLKDLNPISTNTPSSSMKGKNEENNELEIEEEEENKSSEQDLSVTVQKSGPGGP